VNANKRKLNAEYNPLSLETMEVPNALYLECTSCGEETLHRVIKGSLKEKKDLVLNALVKCSKCGFKYQSIIRTPMSISVPIIVSDQESSEKGEIELTADEIVNVGDEFHLDEGTVKITAIEVKSKRVESSLAKEITTLWAKKFDKIKLGISINKGEKTLTRTLWAVPDEEFFVGDVMKIKGLSFTIHRIKTQNKNLKQGSAAARDIVRLYAKTIR
jgi:uncharacterized Zn finger protein